MFSVTAESSADGKVWTGKISFDGLVILNTTDHPDAYSAQRDASNQFVGLLKTALYRTP